MILLIDGIKRKKLQLSYPVEGNASTSSGFSVKGRSPDLIRRQYDGWKINGLSGDVRLLKSVSKTFPLGMYLPSHPKVHLGRGMASIHFR